MLLLASMEVKIWFLRWLDTLEDGLLGERLGVLCGVMLERNVRMEALNLVLRLDLEVCLVEDDDGVRGSVELMLLLLPLTAPGVGIAEV